MNKFLSACALVALTATATMAADTPTVAQSIGQPVYDTTDSKVGVIKGETSETGTPSAIVAITNVGGDRQVLIAEDSIQPRASGGWLASLSPSSISQLQPYVPGKMGPG